MRNSSLQPQQRNAQFTEVNSETMARNIVHRQIFFLQGKDPIYSLRAMHLGSWICEWYLKNQKHSWLR